MNESIETVLQNKLAEAHKLVRITSTYDAGLIAVSITRMLDSMTEQQQKQIMSTFPLIVLLHGLGGDIAKVENFLKWDGVKG